MSEEFERKERWEGEKERKKSLLNPASKIVSFPPHDSLRPSSLVDYYQVIIRFIFARSTGDEAVH